MPSLSRSTSSSKLWNAHCKVLFCFFLFGLGSMRFDLVHSKKGVKQYDLRLSRLAAFQLTFQSNQNNKVTLNEKLLKRTLYSNQGCLDRI